MRQALSAARDACLLLLESLFNIAAIKSELSHIRSFALPWLALCHVMTWQQIPHLPDCLCLSRKDTVPCCNLLCCAMLCCAMLLQSAFERSTANLCFAADVTVPVCSWCRWCYYARGRVWHHGGGHSAGWSDSVGWHFVWAVSFYSLLQTGELPAVTSVMAVVTYVCANMYEQCINKA